MLYIFFYSFFLSRSEQLSKMSKIINEQDLVEIREKSPLAHLKIQDDTVLYKNPSRLVCPGCQKHMKHYCYHCYNVMGMDRSQVPFVKLPVGLDM